MTRGLRNQASLAIGTDLNVIRSLSYLFALQISILCCALFQYNIKFIMYYSLCICSQKF
jgi:hypothetical protein